MVEETGSNQSDNDRVISSDEAMSFKHSRKWLILNTHLNAVMYSSCFWIQIGVLPVSGHFESDFSNQFVNNHCDSEFEF